MRKTIRALVLVLALGVCAHAGDMGNGFTDPPPPPPTASMTNTSISTTEVGTEQVAGEMGNGVVSTATETALNLIQAVLTLF